MSSLQQTLDLTISGVRQVKMWSKDEDVGQFTSFDIHMNGEQTLVWACNQQTLSVALLQASE